MRQRNKNEVKVVCCAPKIQKKKKTKKANQIIVCNQKLNHISKSNLVDRRISCVDQVAWPIHLKEEIIMEILSRLPVQSLLRFKCVSKFWEALISDPYFKMKHFNCTKNGQDSQKLLIRQMSLQDGLYSLYRCPLSSPQLVQDVQKLDSPLIPRPTVFKIRCCYDGFVVVEVLDDLNGYRPTLLLWNPSTRESILLPVQEFEPNGGSCFGMGYDSTSGEYKILHVYQEIDRFTTLPTEILALKGGSWRRIDKHPRGFSNMLVAMNFLAFVHAAIHWVGCSRESYFVVSFSISNEVYGEIPFPEEMLSLRGPTKFGVSVLEGMLCIHSNTYHPGRHTFKLWALKEYAVKESWIPLFAIEDPSIYSVVPKYRFANGEVLFLCKIVESPWWSFRTPSGPFVSWPQSVRQVGYAFTESLISPKSLTY